MKQSMLRVSAGLVSAFCILAAQAQTTVTVPGQSVQVAPSSVTVPQDPAIPALAARISAAEAAIKALQAAPVPTPPASTPETDPPVVVPPVSSISAADIFAGIDALQPFSRQIGGAGLECNGGKRGSVSALSDSTGYSATNPTGMRFGKVPDPLDPSKLVLQFSPTVNDSLADPGSRRCEVSWWTTTSGAIKPYVEIWHAFGLLMPDGGYDFQAVISQYHQTTKDTVNPWSAIQAEKDRLMLFVRYNLNSPPTQATNQTRAFPSPGIPKTKWTVIVIKMRIDPRASGQGYFQAWRDGVQFANYTGPTGYATIDQNPTWQKFGFYPWDYANWKTPTAVRVLFKAPVYVKDPTGSRYTEAALRAYVLAR